MKRIIAKGDFMKKILTYVLLMLLVIFPSCKISEKSSVYICDNDEYKSYLSDFYTKDEKVHFLCELWIYSDKAKTQTVELEAHSDEDYESGLIKTNHLIGYEKQKLEKVIQLEKGYNHVIVDFVGEFGGGDVKYDRLLPEITIKNITGSYKIEHFYINGNYTHKVSE